MVVSVMRALICFPPIQSHWQLCSSLLKTLNFIGLLNVETLLKYHFGRFDENESCASWSTFFWTELKCLLTFPGFVQLVVAISVMFQFYLSETHYTSKMKWFRAKLVSMSHGWEDQLYEQCFLDGTVIFILAVHFLFLFSPNINICLFCQWATSNF